MTTTALLQKKKGHFLWSALVALGFQPDIAQSSVAGKINSAAKYINLGPNMFDKPNKDAFYIVIHFLLEKLNKSRFREAYRYCWPVLTHKADAEFRKVTCAWLKEIMDETANAGSKVVASLFLSPGGPKFTSLMLDLAYHVMLQEMKTFSTDGSWVPEAAAVPASSVDMAVKRFNLIRTRFLKVAQDQDRFLHEYQRRAQLLVKSMKDIKADGAKYDELLKRHSNDLTEGEDSLAKKTKKIRSLWLVIDEMLSTIKEDQNVMASVLMGDEDSNILDGTNRALRIPRCLLERIEKLPQQLSSGKVYEAGHINLLCVMELMNHTLQLLKEERSLASQGPTVEINSQHLQEKRQQMECVLHNLQFLREKISKEELPEVRNAIRNLEADWDKKWKKTLKDRPLVSFLNEDPALGFLSPMAPLSFEPVPEATYRNSVFSQYPAKLLEEKPAESKLLQDVLPGYHEVKSFSPALVERIEKTESPLVTTEPSQANTSLDWLFDTTSSPPLKATSAPPQGNEKKTTHVNRKVAPVRTKAQILEMECDNLADQFADAVTAMSPSEGSVKGLDLEGLLTTLQRDPFSTRKQLPRTPESLIMDVKSSWRKALAEEDAKKNRKSSEFTNSVIAPMSPLDDSHNVLMSPDASSQMVSCSVGPMTDSHVSPPICQQGLLLKSTLSWDTFNTEVLDNSSGRGSTAVHFSLDHETLPELPNCDSLLSLDDEAVDMKSDEDDDLLIPSLKPEAKQSPSVTRHHLGQIQQACSNRSLMRTPECLLTDYKVSGLDRDWLMEPATSVETPDKVFSLDLDSLDMPSPAKNQDYTLPKLITFSPIDDMKC